MIQPWGSIRSSVWDRLSHTCLLDIVSVLQCQVCTWRPKFEGDAHLGRVGHKSMLSYKTKGETAARGKDRKLRSETLGREGVWDERRYWERSLRRNDNGRGDSQQRVGLGRPREDGISERKTHEVSNAAGHHVS